MILDTKDFYNMPELTSARLSESADGVSELSLEFAGWGPAWVGYGATLTVVHRGQPIWHGKLLDPVRDYEGRVPITKVTGVNAMWMLDHQPIGQQLASAENTNDDSRHRGRTIAMANMASWDAMARGFSFKASGWACKWNGMTWVSDESARVTMDASKAKFSLAPVVRREGRVTALEAIQKMRSCNPDCVYRARPDGVIEVISWERADELRWNVDDDPYFVQSIEGVAAKHDEQLTGVVGVISYTDPHKGSVRIVEPNTLDMESLSIKLFTFTAPDRQRALNDLVRIRIQLRNYLTAANVLQWRGTVVVDMDKLNESPLARRLSITGEGLPVAWATMRAMVGGVEWDLRERQATLSLGLTVQEPEIHQAQFEPTGDVAAEEAPEEEGEPEEPDCDSCDCDSEEPDPPPPAGCSCAENWTAVQNWADQVAHALGDLMEWYELHWGAPPMNHPGDNLLFKTSDRFGGVLVGPELELPIGADPEPTTYDLAAAEVARVIKNNKSEE